MNFSVKFRVKHKKNIYQIINQFYNVTRINNNGSVAILCFCFVCIRQANTLTGIHAAQISFYSYLHIEQTGMGTVSFPLTVGKLQKEHISRYKRLYV